MSPENLVTRINKIAEKRLLVRIDRAIGIEWQTHLQPLDVRSFPDDAEVASLVTPHHPKSFLSKKLERALKKMGVDKEYQHFWVRDAIQRLANSKVSGQRILRRQITLGDARKLTPEALSKIDGFNRDVRASWDGDQLSAHTIVANLFGINPRKRSS